MDVKTAIRTGDAEALRRLLAEDPSRANALIVWGKDDRIRTHPLHYIADVLFEGTLERGKELPLADALIESGTDVDFQVDSKGDTPLLGAASLGAEALGLRLLNAGAKRDVRGLFGETALHWAALLGEDGLVARLIEASDLNLKDDKYESPPLGWAIHGWCNPQGGNQGGHHEVVTLLVAAGAAVEQQWLENTKVSSDPAMLAALRAGSR